MGLAETGRQQWREVLPMSEQSELTQAKRNELLDKITALLAKTTANGCTEAEAIAAAGLAEKLMAKYGFSLAEFKALEPAGACEQFYTETGRTRTHEAQYVADAIAAFTDTRYWWQRQRWRPQTDSSSVGVVFFGLSADVQIATYLFKVIRAAMDFEWQRYWKAERRGTRANPRSERKAFMQGMTNRLRHRLYQMKRERDNKSGNGTNDCRAVVLVRIARSSGEPPATADDPFQPDPFLQTDLNLKAAFTPPTDTRSPPAPMFSKWRPLRPRNFSSKEGCKSFMAAPVTVLK